jgi:Domain of unknown function (DU1801)
LTARTKARRARRGEPGSVLRFYSAPVRSRLAALRRLILETAKTTEGVGAIEETLKWGQPSFATSQTRSGSPIRIDAVKSNPKRYAMYFHCQTNLVASFRQLYPKEFAYEGNRAILFDVDKSVPEKPLRHCIALALTYHARKT